MEGVNDDFRDLLTALTSVEARYLVVGAHASAAHGHSGPTSDLELWVEASRENAPRVLRALEQFGAPPGPRAKDLQVPGLAFRLGAPPSRMQFLTKIAGLRFDEAWSRRVEAELAPGVKCHVLALADLIASMRATGRARDLAEVTALERLRAKTLN